MDSDSYNFPDISKIGMLEKTFATL